MTRTFAGPFAKPARTTALATALVLTATTPAPARTEIGAAGDVVASFAAPAAAVVVAATRDTAARAPALPPVDPNRTLPSACRFDIRDGADRGSWYNRRCLVANFAHWPFLPDRCEQRVDLPRRHPAVLAYDAICLARFGFGPDDGALPVHR